MKKHLSKFSFLSAIVLILLLVISFTIPCASAQGIVFLPNVSECWGVFVGISSFQNFPGLNVQFADSGQQDLYNKFVAVWGTDHCRLLTNTQATKAGILNAIDWMAGQADGNDTVLFSARSYGSAGPGGDYYFYSYNSNLADFDNDISSQELSNAFDTVPASKTVFVLSFARAGGFETNLSGAGRVILMACKVDEAGYWDTPLANSVFVYFVIDAINNFDTADTNNDDDLSAEEIFNYASPATTAYDTNQGFLPAQQPVLSDGYSGDVPVISKFVFSTNIGLPAGSTAVTIDGTSVSSVPVTRYWTPGGTHTITAPDLVSGGTGTRYVFTGWTGGDTTATRNISKGSYIANFNKEYSLTIDSPYDTPTGAGWYVDGTTASFSITAYLETSNTKRYFTGWSGAFTGTSATGSVVMNAPKSLTASWRTEFLLTLNSEFGAPTGAGWYNENGSANISVESVQGFIIRHIFDSWSGDLTSTAASTSVTMSGPMVITANWHTDYMQLYILIIVVVVLLGIIITIVVIRRRGGTPRVPPTAAPPAYSPPPPAAGPPSAPPPPPPAPR
jgi:hypothetical protein